MEIIKNFGLEPIQLGAQIVNFLLVLYILKKFLYKPILDILDKRDKKIKQGLKDAEEARLTLEKAEQEESKILSKARDQAKKITEDSKIQADAIAKKIEYDAKIQAERMIEAARAQIEQDSKLAEKQLVGQIGKLSVDMLSSSLKNLFNDKTEEQIINKALAKIKHSN